MTGQHDEATAPDLRSSLAARLRQAGAEARAPGIPRTPRAELAPTSFAEERLWFLWRYDPQSPAYACPVPIHLHGPLDAPALRVAIELVVARHEVLRTTFTVVDGRPMQRVGAPGSIELPLDDLSALPEAERAACMEALTRQWVALPFDLERGPVVRFRLLRLAPEHHVLLLVAHHSVWDGWSRAVFVREVDRGYRELVAGPEPALPDLPLQYADYAAWQREQLSGERLERLVAWWREHLAGAPPTSVMPTDRPRPAQQTHEGARVHFHVPAHIADAVRRAGADADCTLFMTLLAAWGAFMLRYTGQEDLLVGTPVAGRSRVELEELIGLFANTLVLRLDLSGDPDFPTLLQRVRRSALGAYEHQELPFERLVEELSVERDPSRTPLFQVAFQVRNFQRGELQVGSLRAEIIDCDAGTAKFDLNVEVIDRPDGLAGLIEYNTSLFEPATAQRMAGHFANLLASIAEAPRGRVSELRLLSEQERRRAVVEWNATATDYPSAACVHGLFDAQATARPDAVAARDAGREISYAELRDRADRLAAYLREAGVGAGTLVGVCTRWSADTLVALLGVLKAGAAYLPLDPEHPAKRLEFMMRDGDVAVLLTQEALLERLPEHSSLTLCLDRDAAQIAAAGHEPPAVEVTADDLAYVTYTSGSTGRPKGVAVPHRAVVRLVVGTDYVDLGPADVVAQLGSLAFDASTFEVWGALLTGARLAMIPREVVLAPAALCERLAAEGVTAVFMTTALLNRVAAEVPAGLAGLGTVIFGGEACDPRAVRAVLDAGPPARLLHAYGPTENTTFSTTHLVTEVAPDAVTVPIGRPIANSTAYVLDAHRQPAPVGAAGELYVGGDGLARGYRRRPELTAQRFVAHPFSDQPGARLCRTGDLARYRADGAIEWLGRLDDQVKIRGHRVEPAEVQTALSAHADVSEAVVLARGDAAGERRLVAWVVARARAEATEAELRAWLEGMLPRAMVPAQFVFVEALPLGPTGKVNRSALPDPGAPAAGQPVPVAPRDQMERALLAAWERTLGVEGIGVTDSFFDVGGHSLLAAALMAEIEAEAGVSAPLSLLFVAPTIERLARELRAIHRGVPAPTVLPLRSDGSGPTIFAPHILDSLDLGYQRLADALQGGLNLSVLFDPSLTLGPDRADSVEDLAAALIEPMLQAQPRGPYFLLGYCISGVVTWEMARQLTEAGQQVPLLVLIEARTRKGARARASLRTRLHAHAEHVRGRGPAGLLGYVAERAAKRWQRVLGWHHFRRGGRVPEAAQREAWQAGALHLRERYDVPPLAVPVVVVRARPAWFRADVLPDLGWSACAHGPLSVVDVDAPHAVLDDLAATADLGARMPEWVAQAGSRVEAAGHV